VKYPFNEMSGLAMIDDFYAEIPSDRRKNGINFLILEKGVGNDEGFFLIEARFVDREGVYDNWFENREDAIEFALEVWGVAESDWIQLNREKLSN